jgi:hypothetical protein
VQEDLAGLQILANFPNEVGYVAESFGDMIGFKSFYHNFWVFVCAFSEKFLLF